MRTFLTCVEEQMRRHPSMEPRDMYKLCYQAAFGAEHLVGDEEKAFQYLTTEFKQVKADTKWPLVEWISMDVARVNLTTYKALQLPIEELYREFLEGAKKFQGNENDLQQYIKEITRLAAAGKLSFDEKQWENFLLGREIGPVHHSPQYRLKEEPAYRVVSGEGIKHIESLVDEIRL